VRILQFHTDLGGFYPVYKVWERKLEGRPVPFCALQVSRAASGGPAPR
jgi:hypothetical protein